MLRIIIWSRVLLICPSSFILQKPFFLRQIVKKLNSTKQGPFFGHFCVSNVITLYFTSAHKWCHFHIFPRPLNIKNLRCYDQRCLIQPEGGLEGFRLSSLKLAHTFSCLSICRLQFFLPRGSVMICHSWKTVNTMAKKYQTATHAKLQARACSREHEPVPQCARWPRYFWPGLYFLPYLIKRSSRFDKKS